jgi:hypothetical protein
VAGSARMMIKVGRPLAAALAFLIGTARASPAVAQLKTAVQFEPVHMEIDLYRFGAIEEIFVDYKLETIHIELLIRIIRLIQSHGQAGTASAAFIKEDPNGTDFLAFKIGRNLFTGRRCNFEHDVLLTNSTLLQQSQADC